MMSPFFLFCQRIRRQRAAALEEAETKGLGGYIHLHVLPERCALHHFHILFASRLPFVLFLLFLFTFPFLFGQALTVISDDRDVENILWQKTHNNFKDVMTEMARFTDAVLSREEDLAQAAREPRHLEYVRSLLVEMRSLTSFLLHRLLFSAFIGLCCRFFKNM